MKKLKEVLLWISSYIIMGVTMWFLMSFITDNPEGYIKVRKEGDNIIIVYSTMPYRFVNGNDTINVSKDFKEKRFNVNKNDYTFVVE